MRQAQSYRPRPTTRTFQPDPSVGSRGRGGRDEADGRGGLALLVIETAFHVVWGIVTFPFRLVRGVISLLSRMTGVVIGFSLMVVGIALGAGPFYLIGVPIFLIGLLMTLRCLG